MTITVDYYPGIVVIHLNGAFCYNSIDPAKNTWEEVIDMDIPAVAIDCGGLTSIDSSALGTLVHFFKNTSAKDIPLIFFDLSDSVNKIFSAARFDKFFNIMSRTDFEEQYCPSIVREML